MNFDQATRQINEILRQLERDEPHAIVTGIDVQEEVVIQEGPSDHQLVLKGVWINREYRKVGVWSTSDV